MNRNVQKKVSALRKQNGSSLLEIPVGIWLVIIVLFMPVLSLSIVTLRYTLFTVAVQDAVHAASKAKTFELDNQDGKSAQTIARETFQKRIADFSGLKQQGTFDLDILESKITTQQQSRFENKLQVPADSTNSVYLIEAEAQGTFDPVIQMDKAVVGAIPGLSIPVLVTLRAREVFENPQGLNR